MHTRRFAALALGVLFTLRVVAQTVDTGPKTYSTTATVVGSPGLSTSGSVSITSGGNVTYKGGTGASVSLEPGFSVTGGGQFHAQIVPLAMITDPNVDLTGLTGTAFSYQVTASNGPISSYRIFGSLPTGLSFNTATGLVSGTPNLAGSWAWFVYATNAYGEGPPGQFSMTVTGGSSPPVTTITATTSATTVTGNSNSASPPILLVASGQSYTITSVTTDSGNDLVTQQFDLSFDGGATWSLANTNNNRIWSGPATGSNTLSKTFTLGDGTYLFRAQGEDSGGVYSTYQYVYVYLGTAPAITTQPQSQSATAGSNVTFSVACSGSASISFQWLKNGSAIAGATSSSLTLSNVQSSDAATYACVASNYMGSATSSGAALTVSSAPPQQTDTTNQNQLNIQLPY